VFQCPELFIHFFQLNASVVWVLVYEVFEHLDIRGLKVPALKHDGAELQKVEGAGVVSVSRFEFSAKFFPSRVVAEALYDVHQLRRLHETAAILVKVRKCLLKLAQLVSRHC
jgi:hypothetical protein